MAFVHEETANWPEEKGGGTRQMAKYEIDLKAQREVSLALAWG
jgi:hypothetical protein